MSCITTRSGHVSRALDFYNKSSIFFGLGKTSNWDDENNPPSPTDTEEFVEPVGYKKVESKFLVVPDNENGELSYKSNKWKIVSPEEAIEKGAKWVYITTTISYDELPTNISYRQVAVFTGLEPVDSADPKSYVYRKDEVSNQGIIEVIDNRTPTYREADQREKLVIILEF